MKTWDIDERAWELFYHYYGDDYLSPAQAYLDTEAFLAERQRRNQGKPKKPLAEVFETGLYVGGQWIADDKRTLNRNGLIVAASIINKAAEEAGE